MLDIQPFDAEAATPADWAQYHAYRRRRAAQDEPGEPVLSDAEFEHDTRRQWPLSENRRFLAWHDGRIVGNAGFGFRRPGTPDHAAFAPFMYGWAGVCQDWRRRGIATALLRPLHAFMRDSGKTTLTTGVNTLDGHAFLAALGGVEKQRNVVNRLDFARLDWDELARWEAGAEVPGSGLAWEIHVGRVPPDRLTELQPHFSRLLGDVPMGALDVPPMRMELTAYQSWYAEMDRRGGDHFVAVLRHGDAIAGLCEAHWSARFPDRVYQELTGVSRAWRGRGLGKALKAAMLRLVRERHPEVRMASTWNAEVNAPILSINRRLGFEVHRRESSYQVDRDVLGDWLAGRSEASAIHNRA